MSMLGNAGSSISKLDRQTGENMEVLKYTHFDIVDNTGALFSVLVSLFAFD